MDKKKGISQMLIPTIIMAALAVGLVAWSLHRGDGHTRPGLAAAAKLTLDVLPLLIFAFIVAGMIQVMIPAKTVSSWVGSESGMRGILIGTVAGGLCPGGPYVSLPILLGLKTAGAGLGTLVAFLTAWSLWAVARLPMEVGIMGWKFTLIRFATTFFFPPLAGLLAHALFSGVKT